MSLPIDVVYDQIKHNDIASVTSYLNSLPSSTIPTLDRIDQLLSYAVRWNKLDMVKLLLTYCANPNTWVNGNLFYIQQYAGVELTNLLLTGIDIKPS